MGAYTYRTSGTVSPAAASVAVTPSAGTHGVSYQTGDLLLCVAVNRAPTQTVASITGWTQLYAYALQGSIEVWGRIADGGANDVPTVDWSGTAQAAAWIDVFYGDVYTDLATIVHASNAESSTSATVPRCPALSNASNSFTEADCLLYAVGKRSTTADSASAVAAPSGLTLAQSWIDNSFGFITGSAYVQQTTQTDFAGADFTPTGSVESAASSGIIIALRSEEPAATESYFPKMYRKPNVLLRM